jgi:HTH-type transcriptional regulator/antitoxin HigA
MSAIGIPDYGTLLAETQPSVVNAEQENERFIAVLEQLAFKTELSEAERKLVELLTLVVQDFESRHYQLEDASPIGVLTELMAEHDLKQKDLVEIGIFATPSVVSEVLNGKRELTKDHIKRLSKHFNVSPLAFLDFD